jgi:hypothetical protein
MKSGSRDEPGTRLHAEQQFREGAIQILVATEAAGEGINLQVCNILFNYDIPWNPNRLEQRMGRIHRYGQRKDCLIFNFVASNTIEGHVLQRLLEKLQEIRDALEDDAVFNVVGEVLPAAHVERVLRDYYAGRLGDADLEDRLLRDVDESQFRAICQNALEGLASKKLNLEMLIERRARAQERRVVPETIARFLGESAEFVPLTLKPVSSLAHVGGARMLAVVMLRADNSGRHYRVSNEQDYEATRKAQQRISQILDDWESDGRRSVCPFPDEPVKRVPVPFGVINVWVYGMLRWGDLFTARQKLALKTLAAATAKLTSPEDSATQRLIAISVDKTADLGNALAPWKPDAECPVHLFSRQSIGMAWDFAESVPT